jgi:outer membrane protein assembly factor BamB
MRGVLPVVERRCPDCAATVRGRDARWCGSCGCSLDAADTRGPDGGPRRRSGGTLLGSLAGRLGGGSRGTHGTRGAEATRAGSGSRLGHVPRNLLAAAGVVGGALLVAGIVAGGGLVDRAAAERSTSVRDVAVAGPDASLRAEFDRRPAPPPPPPRTEPACVRGGTDDCFLWTHEAEEGTFDLVTRAGDLVLTSEAGSEVLEARDLRDGQVRWSAPVATRLRSDVGGWMDALLGVEDLLLTSEGRELVARELATGRERWRVEDLGALQPYQGVVRDGLLVLAGDDRRAESIQAATSVAAGLDLETGEVRWREGALSVSLAADGVTVLTTGEGRLRAHDPDGTLRWEAAEPVESRLGASVWADGHVVTVHDGTGGAQLLRLTDGEPLGVGGSPVAHDDDATFVELYGGADEEVGAGGSAVVAYALFDADGEVWRTEDVDWADCFQDVRLRPAVVRITTCDGDRIDLRRDDGTVVVTEAGDRPGQLPSIFHTLRVGAYDLVYRHPRFAAEGTGDELVVHDAASGREVALLPPETWPLWTAEGWDGEQVVVLQATDRVVVLPSGIRTWNGRSNGTPQLRVIRPSLSVRPR